MPLTEHEALRLQLRELQDLVPELRAQVSELYARVTELHAQVSVHEVQTASLEQLRGAANAELLQVQVLVSELQHQVSEQQHQVLEQQTRQVVVLYATYGAQQQQPASAAAAALACEEVEQLLAASARPGWPLRSGRPTTPSSWLSCRLPCCCLGRVGRGDRPHGAGDNGSRRRGSGGGGGCGAAPRGWPFDLHAWPAPVSTGT